MGKVCVFFAEGFEEIEALTVVDLLRRVGVDTAMVSVSGGLEVRGSHGVAVGMDLMFNEVDFQEVDMLVLPGGMPGTRNLEEYQPLMEVLDLFHSEERFISAICAAPSILGHRGMLKGRKACCFPDFETHLEGAEVSRNEVEVSGHFITARGMGCSIAFALAVVERLMGQENAEELAEKILFKASKG